MASLNNKYGFWDDKEIDYKIIEPLFKEYYEEENPCINYYDKGKLSNNKLYDPVIPISEIEELRRTNGALQETVYSVESANSVLIREVEREKALLRDAERELDEVKEAKANLQEQIDELKKKIKELQNFTRFDAMDLE